VDNNTTARLRRAALESAEAEEQRALTNELVAALEGIMTELPKSWAGCTTTFRDKPVECPCHMHSKLRRLHAAIAAVKALPSA